eukprot:CAMPEP_0179292344 /NCGR_PEP_ID=MMETSP0797-20121207/42809_1 /TAXON_ID=47934 /ORGANISM="Dinophysis acuminata, Strain DAEP01" /LENGTH=278 /DNA_ID=CAMNT_0021001457 /DNA_START=32 /DNA_END=868 /DNA_ORIENTATION=+
MAAALQRVLLVCGALAPRTTAFPGFSMLTPHLRIPKAISKIPQAVPNMQASHGGNLGNRAGAQFPSRQRQAARMPAMQLSKSGTGGEAQSSENALELLKTPFKATTIIGKWMQNAPTAPASQRHASHTEGQADMQEVIRSLQSMQTKLDKGEYTWVFALTTGEEAENIQEIAAVTSAHMWDNSAQKDVEVLFIDAVASNPVLGESTDLRVALIHQIIGWAAASGRLVAIRSAKTLVEFYKSLGYEVNNAWRQSLVFFGANESEALPSQSGLQMIALEA